jgi:hypothetical protein
MHCRLEPIDERCEEMFYMTGGDEDGPERKEKKVEPVARKVWLRVVHVFCLGAGRR